MTTSDVRKIRIFVSSPGDVQAERDAVKQVVEQLGHLNSIRNKYFLDVYRYEDSVPPLAGEIPQKTVDDFLGSADISSIFVCILWKRMGTPFIDSQTGQRYISGTFYEFETAYSSYQQTGSPRILLYRKVTETFPDELKNEQMHLVDDFFGEIIEGKRKAIIHEFASSEDFKARLSTDLQNVINSLESADEVSTLLGGNLEKTLLERFKETNSALRDLGHIGENLIIERQEIHRIVEWIDNPPSDTRVAFLIDKPGSGKTVAMSQLLSLLEKRQTTVIAIKAELLSGIRSSRDLQEFYKLPVPFDECVKLIAGDEPVVILIDQVDALSLSLSQNFPVLDIVYQMVLDLREVPNTRLVISCREFDINFDPRLSRLKPLNAPKFSLGPLNESQISEALAHAGFDAKEKISSHMLELLSNPLQLAIYIRLISTPDANVSHEEFHSLHQLYNELWRLRVTATDVPYVSEAIYKVTDRMITDRSLTAPDSVLDEQQYQAARIYLRRVDFLRERYGVYVYFHQTFLDYSYARKFVAEGRELSSYILSSAQGLMERTLMLQVLVYLRHANPEVYSRELTQLVFSEELRFHLRLLLIQWVASLDKVSASENAVARRLLTTPNDAVKFIAASANNVNWLDELPESLMQALLSDLETRWYTVRYLSTVINVRPQKTTQLLKTLAGKSREWDWQILYCLERLHDWSDDSAALLLEDILNRESDPHSIGACLVSLMQSRPERCCIAFRVYLDHIAEKARLAIDTINEQSKTALEMHLADYMRFDNARRLILEPLSTFHVQQLLATLPQAAPLAFVENTLSWLINVAKEFSSPSNDRHFPSDYAFGNDVETYHSPQDIGGRKETTFIQAMGVALQNIAQADVSKFRKFAERIRQVESITCQFVLAQGYLADPKTYADDIYEFVSGDERRLDLGNRHYESCRLVAAAYMYSNSEKRQALEFKLLNMYPNWEKDPTHELWGSTQILFLKAIPREFLSTKAERRLQELERKFPDLEPSPRVNSEGPYTVESPISVAQLDKANDEDILKAMRHYDESTDWDSPNRRRSSQHRGGIVELSRAIAEHAAARPQRYFELAQKFDDTVAPMYITQILSGLSQGEIASSHVFEFAQMHQDRIHGYHRIGFCNALARRAADKIPFGLVDTMIEWALTDPDPQCDDLSQVDEKTDQTLDWFGGGINSVRGVALRAAISGLLNQTMPNAERAFTLLSQAANDPCTKVAACALERLSFLFGKDQDRAFDLCETIINSHPLLLDDSTTKEVCLNALSFYHFERFGKYVSDMLSSNRDGTRELGAYLACQAFLVNVEAKELSEKAANGDAHMRRGAATVYARYLTKIEFSEQCKRMLLQLASDEDEEVLRMVALCFANAKPERDFDLLRSFIQEILYLPAIEQDPHHLLNFVTQIADVEHDLALRVTERMISILKIKLRERAFMPYDDVVCLPLAVYNRSNDFNTKNRAMDLFEQLLDMGIRSADKALENWDEHRTFAIKLVTE